MSPDLSDEKSAIAVVPQPVGKSGKYPRAERVLVWGGILLMLTVVAIEYRARTGYMETVQAFSAASDDHEQALPMHRAEQLMSLSPAREHTAVNGIENTYAYTWLSLFRYGQFQVNVVYTSGENPSLLRFWTGAGHDPMTPYMDGEPVRYTREELQEAMRNAMGRRVAVWVGNDEGDAVSAPETPSGGSDAGKQQEPADASDEPHSESRDQSAL